MRAPTVLALCCAFAAAAAAGAQETPRRKRVAVLPVSGEVNYVMYSSLKRRLGVAAAAGCGAVLLDLDTYGGTLVDAERIVSLLEHEGGMRVYVFVKEKALSAGAYISMAADGIVMHPTARLGDCMPIVPFGGTPADYQEKMRSPIRKKFEALADKNGYPAALAAAMVDPTVEVHRVRLRSGAVESTTYVAADEMPAARQRWTAGGVEVLSTELVLASGKLLTMTGKEAKEFGFAAALADDLQEALAAVPELRDAEVLTFVRNWWEHFIAFLNWGPITSLLLILGGVCLFIEMKTPGFAVPGIIGISCLAVVFLSAYLAGLASVIELLMIIAGAVLLFLEVFVIPGFGAAGITGIVLLVAGGLLALQPFVIPVSPVEMAMFKNNLLIVFGSVIAIAFGVMLVSRYLPQTSRFRKLLVLVPDESGGMHAAAAAAERRADLVAGRTGVAATTLRPAGKAEFSGRLTNVVTQGEFIEAGERVVVVEVAANRIVVKRASS